MESNAMETTSSQTKFAATIQTAWGKACDIYLKESGLKVDSEEWKFIKDTKDPGQIIEVITNTWTHYTNQSTITTTAPTQYIAASSKPKKQTGFRATVNRMIGRKSTGNILVQSSAIQHGQSHVDERSALVEKMSGKHSKGKAIATTGLEITTQLQSITNSDTLKTVVDTVVKFSDGLQQLADMSAVVSFR
jgi:hypothetical protein